MVGTMHKLKNKLRGSLLLKKESAYELNDDSLRRKHTQDETVRVDRSATLTDTVNMTDDVEEMFYNRSTATSGIPQYRTTEQIRGNNLALYALHEDFETQSTASDASSSFSQFSATTPSSYAASTPGNHAGIHHDFSTMYNTTSTLPAISGDFDLERLHSEVLKIKSEVKTIRREVMNELHVTRYDVLKELTLLKGAIAQLASTKSLNSSSSVSSTDSSSSDPLSSDERAALTRQTPTKTSQATRDRLAAPRINTNKAPPRAIRASARLTQLAPVADDALSTPLNSQQINESFPLIDFTSELAAHARSLTPGSRSWALTRIQEWLDARFHMGNDTLLAVVGEGGSGKSAFCGTVAQQFRGNLLAAHCCQFDRKSKSRPRNVLLSMVHQLVDNLPLFKNQLARLNLRYVLEETDPFLLANKVLIDPLNALEEPTHSTFILIDGIDQCATGSNGRNELLEFISQIISLLPSWVGFLVSSKPSSKLAKCLPVSSVLDFSAKNGAFVADASSLVEDISQYFSDDDAVEAKRMLTKKSGGNFAYLEFTKQALSHPGMAVTSTNGVVPLSVLRELPETLYDIYAEIFEDKFGQGHARAWGKAKPLLQLIVGAAAGPYSLVTEEQAKKQLDLNADDLRMLRRSFVDIVAVKHEEQFYFSIEDALLALRKMRLNSSSDSSSGDPGISSDKNAPDHNRRLSRANSRGKLPNKSQRHEPRTNFENYKPVGILKRGKL
ncbi:FOG: Ankyrin repeat [Plasmopara halstedii]|uniref:FOG: Ankyrin repeat n=1 Tax=Plasmopara halstedii TaxID=4781 RepID=A0A0P1B2I8_PLAHL|nr:FOG: Ankyrin repeat [Plasmopara halstedii]CEG48665.1 FOG: Ankyrin repeat [Plasmopara halstedii]|eukprot:XP_024585034.1 FOG: Ankyrin repeat [Plasmopara halstedii]